MTVPSPFNIPPTPGTRGRTLAAIGLGPALGVVASIALGVAGVLRAMGDERVAVGPIAAALVLASLPLFARAARIAAPSRPGVVLGAAVAGLSPVITLGAAWALAQPVVTSHWRCGSGDIGLVIFAPPALIAAGTLGASIGAALDRNWGTNVALAVRGFGIFTVVCVALFAAAGTAASVAHPDPDGYVASLPVIGRLAAYDAQTSPHQWLAVGNGYGLVRQCVPERDCTGRFTPSPLATSFDPGSFPMGTGAFTLRQDGPGGVIVVQRADDPRHAVAAFEPRNGQLTDVSPTRMVWNRMAPPHGWTVGAWLGVAVAAIVLMAGARRRSWLLARRDSWLAGTLGPDGWITFADGSAPRRATVPGIAPGPVVVVASTDRAPATFRSDGGAAELAVFPGTPAELEARERAGAEGRFALALGAAALMAAPLGATLLLAL